MSVDPRLLDALAAVESGGNPRAVSPAGAQGLFQFMPKTSAWLGVDPWDPVSARQGAERYYRYLLDKFGDPDIALAAWNWGEGNVARNIKTYGRFNLAAAPRETQDFVPRVKSKFDPKGTGYDYATARREGLSPDRTGHWPSRAPVSGQILKGMRHPTFPLTERGEADAGYAMQSRANDRIYSEPDGLSGPLVDLILRALWELP